MHKILKYPMWLIHALIWAVALSIIVMVFTLIFSTSQELASVRDAAEGYSPVPQQPKNISAPTSTPAESAAPVAENNLPPVALYRLEILNTETGYLNVRSEASTKSELVGKALPGETYEYSLKQGGWYQIILNDGKQGWVSGKYAKPLQ